MKDAKEILVKILIFVLVLTLLVVEVLKIDIQVWEIVIKIVVLVLTLAIIVVEVQKAAKRKRLCHAFIYQHKENRSIVYCENDQGDETRDFRRIGEGQIPCDQVGQCFFVR
ncbi:MAG: hypothetical protein ACKV2U_22160 [Bryobacteraceae bacterium]